MSKNLSAVPGSPQNSSWISALEGKKCSVNHLEEGAKRTRTQIDTYNSLCFLTLKEIQPKEAEVPLRDSVYDKFLRKIRVDKEKLVEIGEEYCNIRGYDPRTGIPTVKQLIYFGLEDMAANLEKKLHENKEFINPAGPLHNDGQCFDTQGFGT